MLATIWFLLWILLWAVYFILDGFDLGMGSLMPFLAKNDAERRIIYNASGPYWDGNEVWLIAAGGVTFAAFPLAYATMFSALYAPLLILLFALIFRAVAFEFRNKVPSGSWRGLWDACMTLGNFLPALLLGVAFANLFKGIPIDADQVYRGSLLTLLNPYGLAGGVLFVLMFCYHGALWLELKTVGDLRGRAGRAAAILWLPLLLVVLAFLPLTAVYTDAFARLSELPVAYAALALAVVGLTGSRLCLRNRAVLPAWVLSALFILGLTFFGVLGMFPNLIISSLDPAWSITLFNGGASSPLTLKIMLGVALVGVPVVIAYQAWVYYTFAHRVTQEDLASEHAY
jgi:cytochrome d ubiquinol oxidase subunit II